MNQTSHNWHACTCNNDIFLFPQSGETPVQGEVYDVNSRYDNLKHRINATLEDIALSEEWVNNLNKVNADREWVTASDTKMDRARPMANDIPTLTKEIEVYRVRVWNDI